jgi:hypothetical protein
MAAAPCKILVDDHEPNIAGFRMAFGRGVLIPRPWNSLIDHTDDNGHFDADKTARLVAAYWHEIVKT